MVILIAGLGFIFADIYMFVSRGLIAGVLLLLEGIAVSILFLYLWARSVIREADELLAAEEDA